MDQLAGRDSAEGASVHYILKATAVCGKQCQILRKKDLDDTQRKCLYTCGTNAASTRVAHLRFLESQAQAEATSE